MRRLPNPVYLARCVTISERRRSLRPIATQGRERRRRSRIPRDIDTAEILTGQVVAERTFIRAARQQHCDLFGLMEVLRLGREVDLGDRERIPMLQQHSRDLVDIGNDHVYLAGCRRTISLIQIGAYGDVQPGGVG